MQPITEQSPSGTGQAYGKLLLFGEHVAVYGHPAIGIPLPWKLSVMLKEAPAYSWNLPDVKERTLDVKEKAAEEKIKEQLDLLLVELLDLFPELKNLPPFEMTIQSEIPIGGGFGSSGALCVALLRAFFPNWEEEKLWQAAHQLEAVFHGTPSGVDTGMAVYQKAFAFERKENSDTLPHRVSLKPFRLPLVIGMLPRKESTAVLIQRIADRKNHDKYVKQCLSNLGSIARSAIQVINGSSDGENERIVKKLGRLALSAQESLAALDLSSPKLDRAIQLGMRWGALGGKLSGAGSGGAFFLVAKTEEQAKELKEKLAMDKRLGLGSHLIAGVFN